MSVDTVMTADPAMRPVDRQERGDVTATDPPSPGGQPGRRRVTTLMDVARLAGVSIATASKALNGRDQVSPATRARVHHAAEQLSFSPNALARGLAAGRTGTIGLLTHDLEGRFALPILVGAEDAAGEGSLSVLMCDARGDAVREQEQLRVLLGRRVDGLIVVGDRTDPRAPLPGRLAVPVVYAYAPSRDARDMSVESDNVGAGRLAVEHLLSLGRRRIVHISGDPGSAAAQDRALGALTALRHAGVRPVGDRVHFGTWSESWGRLAMTRVLDAGRPFDAVFCGSDQIARGALEVLRERGRQVPQDVAVVGFDNWKMYAAAARPGLTSIDMRLGEIGRTAAQRLLAALDGRRTGGVQRVDCSLVVRGSTVG